MSSSASSSARDLLTEYQQEILTNFQEIIQIQDDALCIDLLQENGWHLEGALNNFMLGGNTNSISSQSIPNPLTSSSGIISPPPTVTSPLRRNNITSNRSSSTTATASSSNQNRVLNNNSYTAIDTEEDDDDEEVASEGGVNDPSSYERLPVAANPVSNQANGTSSSNILVGTANDRDDGERSGLLDLILIPLRWLFQAKPLSINANRDAEAFVADFNALIMGHYPAENRSNRSLNFHLGSYQSAVALAFTQHKFLLVYLHSPLHEETESFCRSILCHEQFINWVSEHCILWGGRVWDPEAYGLASQLSVSAFPFLSLLIAQSNKIVQVADRIQGIMDLNPLLTRLQNVVTTNTAIIERNRLETERRLEAQRLREQQDLEYQESIEAEQRENERLRLEEEQRHIAEETAKQQEELAAAIALSQKLSREDEIRKIRSRFVQEGGGGVEPQPGPEITTIRFQLPQGKKLTYRFHKTNKIQVISDYLSLQFIEEGDVTKHFSMSTTFPKMEINEMDKTIEELGLHPKAMIYVQDLDA